MQHLRAGRATGCLTEMRQTWLCSVHTGADLRALLTEAQLAAVHEALDTQDTSPLSGASPSQVTAHGQPRLQLFDAMSFEKRFLSDLSGCCSGY